MIESQLFAHVGGGLILWARLRLGANVPIALLSQGDAVDLNGATFEAKDGASLGDIRLGADLRLVGEYGDVATLALGVQVHLPTGDRDAFTGDGGVRVVPRLISRATSAYSRTPRASRRRRTQDAGRRCRAGSEIAFVGTAVCAARSKLRSGPSCGDTVISDGTRSSQRDTPSS